MTDVHKGCCLCGSVQYEVHGAFDHFFLCHCQRCRKDTGSAHAANLFAASAKVVWQSEAEAVTRFDLPGTRHVRSFCKHCGSALPSEMQDGGGWMVPAGSLETEVSLRPVAHLFGASRAAWDQALELVPVVPGLPVAVDAE